LGMVLATPVWLGVGSATPKGKTLTQFFSFFLIIFGLVLVAESPIMAMGWFGHPKNDRFGVAEPTSKALGGDLATVDLS